MKSALAANRHRLWLFGKTYDFYVVTSDIALTPVDYAGNAANPTRRPKSQIVLHCTAGNNAAEGTINWWNNPISGAAGAHYIVERTTPAAQAARPAAGAAPDEENDSGLVDAVRVTEEDMVVYHGGPANRNSIGIEHANVGWGWFAARVATEPSLDGRHSPVSTCPSPINIGTAAIPRWRCNHARPLDENRYIHLGTALGGYTDYQAYEEEQYKTMILLLRHLCITHRIPRQFLGRTIAEVFRHWHHGGAGAMRRVNRKRLYQFRGILHHRNCHADKVCPGIIHRNRLYRGIIDEWWMPVELGGNRRSYYSGPFAPHDYVAGQPTRNAYFRQDPGAGQARIVGEVFRNTDIDAICESNSYFNLDDVDSYYAATETRDGGHYPIGANKIWHGGVHLRVQDSNPIVFAAASGTIVAARVSSNADTDAHALFGSQCFVLIRHRVHTAMEQDPDGLGERINYDNAPDYAFSLYMHLEEPRDLANEHDENPPWFSLWRRDNPDVDVGLEGEKGRVFAPDIEVSVGDILGFASTFRRRRLVHFEVLTHVGHPITMAPWDNVANVVEDRDTNALCDATAIDTFVSDHNQDGIDSIDILRAAEAMRGIRSLHKSEWSLTQESQLIEAIPAAQRRALLWRHIARFTWVSEAIAASASLQAQLGDANGLFWHYHPIKFMEQINSQILAENRDRPEDEHHDTNVEIDDDNFITNFVTWNAATNRYIAEDTDNDRVRPDDVSNDQRYHFSRNEIACNQAGNHNPGPTPAHSSTFSLALLELVERARVHYNQSITVDLSYVCEGHATNPALCCLGTADGLAQHAAGTAIDIHPSGANAARCQLIWNSLAAVVSPFTAQCADNCGTPTQADLPNGYDGVSYTATPASADAKLRARPQQALDAAEVGAFRIHLQLTVSVAAAARADTSLFPVRLHIVFESLTVLDDQDWLGSGEWSLTAAVNGEVAGQMTRSVDTGDVIPLEGWVKDVSIDPAGGEKLQITLSGFDEDLFSDDSIGNVSLEYDANSSPAWGIGGTQQATSSNHSFRISFRVESLNAAY